MGNERPLIAFKCAQCGLMVTRPVRLLDAVPDLPSGDGVDLLPDGCCWRDDRRGKSFGRFLLNLRDPINTRYHDDPRRTNGCCGPSGIDGVNTLCANGHEVATECSDCWTGPHHVELEPQTCVLVELTSSASWRTDTVLSLARLMRESGDFSAMPILADALQDAGCDNEIILDHCRDPNAEHGRGWVVNLMLGQE